MRFDAQTDKVTSHAQATPIGAKGSDGQLSRIIALVREDGMRILLRGAGARMIKIGLGQSVIFFVYDSVSFLLR